MPYFGLGLFIGDTEGDAAVGPIIDGVLRAENGDFLILENGNFLAFD